MSAAWFRSCEHREWGNGTRSDGIYWPGDTPGWTCAVEGCACSENDGPDSWGECPRMKKAQACCVDCEEDWWTLDGEPMKECPRC